MGLLACQGDPTASLRGGPFLITATPDLMFISEGEERSVIASVEDEQLNPLAVDMTATMKLVEDGKKRLAQLAADGNALMLETKKA